MLEVQTQEEAVAVEVIINGLHKLDGLVVLV
jgi:hypothetical protein